MPFGEELNANNVTNRWETQKYNYGEDNVRKRFTGYEKDQETGLDFAEARYYNNQHGRFTAVDPLMTSGKSINPQTFNRYVYCLNNPIRNVDPNGMQVATPRGNWFMPVDERGGADPTRGYRFITRGNSTAGYEIVSTRNSNGQLVGSVQAPSDYGTWEIVFNENGPHQFENDIVPAASVSEAGLAFPTAVFMSSWDRLGYEVKRTPESEAAYMTTGATEDRSLDFYFAVMPAAGVVGKAAMEIRVAETVGENVAERSIIVTEKGLDRVKSHLAQFGPDPGNAGMINRLENSLENGGRVVGADRAFYTHELKESTLMKSGMSDEAAHHAAVAWDGVSYFDLYHPEVFNQYPTLFSPGFKAHWESRPNIPR
jgi:RHS repeat-associated protein